MALSFFKKKDKSSSPVNQPAAAAAPEIDELSTETLLTMNMATSGIVVEETSGAPQSAVDEAAILYASGQADMTERLLKDVLSTSDQRAWYMLFDLYSIQGREKDFDQLALDFALRFESSPPVWQKTASSAAAALRECIDAAAKTAVIRIDFSHIEMVDEAGASECAKILNSATKAKRKLQVSGVDRFIALLQDLNRAIHSRAVHWLLLLELYQTLGQEENFENLAVDYAVRFEVSPPSWSEVQAAVVVQAAPIEPKDDALRLSGEITPSNDSALQQVGTYAASHDEVLVDLAQVTRVDYGSVSQFISVLMHCLGSGKSITLRGHNALIHELFRVMGIDQLAHLVPLHPD